MTFREIKNASGLTLKDFNSLLDIPCRTLEDWCSGARVPPAYVLNLIEFWLKSMGFIKEDG